MLIRPIRKIPDVLIYKVPQAPKIIGYIYRKSGNPELYRMIDTRTGHYVGEMLGDMVVHDKNIHQEFYPIKTPYQSYYIAELNIEERGKGYGSKFVEFAKNLSKQSGGSGRVHLLASRLYDREHPPHIFYRKLGFTSNDKFMNNYIDDCINLNIPIEPEIANNLNMYLPIKGEIYKPKSKFQSFINFLKRFL